MNGLNKVINTIKNDNKIKFSLLFFMLLISYWILAPWLGIGQNSPEEIGNIELKKENYN